MKKQLNKKSLFNLNEAGMVELVLTPEELSTIMENLAFAKNIMSSSLSKMEKLQDLTDQEKSQITELQLRAYAATIVYERLLADSTGEDSEELPSPEAIN